jgi:hypothetical protein
MMNPLLTVGMNSPIFICASSPTSLDASADHRDALLDRPATPANKPSC